MAVSPLPAAAESVTAERPRLILFYSSVSGRCRRTEGFLAQVLQRRRNHDTFDLVKVPVDRRPDLATRFRVEEVPTLLVVEDRKVRKRIVAPSGCRDLEAALAPWLR
ncbi:MAG: thioredoxin family protein [Gaiellaceae bacterium]